MAGLRAWSIRPCPVPVHVAQHVFIAYVTEEKSKLAVTEQLVLLAFEWH